MTEILGTTCDTLEECTSSHFPQKICKTLTAIGETARGDSVVNNSSAAARTTSTASCRRLTPLSWASGAVPSCGPRRDGRSLHRARCPPSLARASRGTHRSDRGNGRTLRPAPPARTSWLRAQERSRTPRGAAMLRAPLRRPCRRRWQCGPCTMLPPGRARPTCSYSRAGCRG